MGDGADDAELAAFRELEEEGIIVEMEDEPETLPAVRTNSGMILTGASATDKLAHAMEVAKALSDVIEQQKLFVNIGGKKHVLVEGWELLGSLLGVFPVVEWSRPLENGWEARVVAKTLDGAEVGSAEMMCTRNENRWRTADDYAIRSMAQTRAVSKSLRAPLGFVMKLAGYEPTPEPEIPPEPTTPATPPRSSAFDPAIDLLPGAISGKDASKQLAGALDNFDPTVDWQDFLSQVTKQVWKKDSWRDLQEDEAQDFWRRLSNAVKKIEEMVPTTGDMPPVEADKILTGFIFAFNDKPLAIIVNYKVIDRPDLAAPLTAEQAEEVEKALAEEDVPWEKEVEED